MTDEDRRHNIKFARKKVTASARRLAEERQQRQPQLEQEQRQPQLQPPQQQQRRQPQPQPPHHKLMMLIMRKEAVMMRRHQSPFSHFLVGHMCHRCYLPTAQI